MPNCKQDACFGIFLFCTGFFLFTLSFRLVLWRNCNVDDPSSVVSQPFNSVTVLKSPLASWWNLWAVSLLSGYWVRKGALYLCSDWVYWCTIQSVNNNFTMLKGIFHVYQYCRCPLRGTGKPPWSLWLNLFLKFTAWLKDLTDHCMCGVQRWGSH